jgi:hypothetical protein
VRNGAVVFKETKKRPVHISLPHNGRAEQMNIKQKQMNIKHSKTGNVRIT